MSLHPDIAAVLAGDNEGCIVTGDCLEIMADMPDGCVDAVVTDPPYGIGFAAQPTKWSRDHDGRQAEAWDDAVPDVQPALAMARWAMVWGGNHFELPPSRGWLVWVKPPGLPTYGSAELCWTNIEMPVRHYEHRRLQNLEKVVHPTQKPIALMEWCLEFIPDADIILDPFCGSGTTCVAAKKLGRRWIGIEIDEKYAEIARNRVKSTPRPLFTEAAKSKPEATSLFAEDKP